MNLKVFKNIKIVGFNRKPPYEQIAPSIEIIHCCSLDCTARFEINGNVYWQEILMPRSEFFALSDEEKAAILRRLYELIEIRF